MTRAIAGLLAALALAGAASGRDHHGGGFLSHPHHAHPINAWMGSHHLHLR